jgi:hypothetical protein
MQIDIKLVVLSIVCCAGVTSAQTTNLATSRAVSRWVWLDSGGRLQYHNDDQGNRIPDFSHCGYRGGGVAIPDLPVRQTLAPNGDGDMRPAIQAALDSIAKLPLDANGFRGALLLKRGTYHISGTLKLAAGGIVLRGESESANGTVLIAEGTTQHTLIECAGSGSRGYDTKQAAHITDDYVPVGSDGFNVDDASRLTVGQTIWVDRPATPEWLHAIGMDRIPPHRSDPAHDSEKVVPWDATYHLRFDRVITAIDGHHVFIDAPLANAIEQKFGGALVMPYHFEGRIEQIGVENLRLDSAFSGPASGTDEKHGWIAIGFTKVQNAWVRDVTSVHFGFGLVNIGRDAKWITVQDCDCLDPVSEISGGRRYSYNIMGELSLVQRCHSREGRHDFVLDSRVPGPNVFLDCRAENAHDDAGPHHRWSTGTLFDNVDTHIIDLQNRLNMGSGQGWAGANSVLWNCRVDEFRIQNPPTAHNWAIGIIGKQVLPSFMVNDEYRQRVPDDYFAAHPTFDPAWGFDESNKGTLDSVGTLVTPRSLYIEQLKERLGAAALVNIGAKP